MKPCVAAVGTFDGIHIGHKAVIKKVVEVAKEMGLDSRIVTFINHPLSVIAPERCPKWAISRDVSQWQIKEMGVGRVSYISFTPELARLTAGEFMKLLRERYAVEVLIMGYDNSFGSDRLKTREDYVEVGKRIGIRVDFVEEKQTEDGETPSSSKLRDAIADGDIERILNLLDDELIFEGMVVRGKRNGHKIGFPTMNINMGDTQPLRDGVYAAAFFPDIDDTRFDLVAVLSVGHNPTIGAGNALTYELHVPGHDLGDMYGQTIRFVVGPRLRDIQKFASLNELKKAISNDIRNSKIIYG